MSCRPCLDLNAHHARADATQPQHFGRSFRLRIRVAEHLVVCLCRLRPVAVVLVSMFWQGMSTNVLSTTSDRYASHIISSTSTHCSLKVFLWRTWAADTDDTGSARCCAHEEMKHLGDSESESDHADYRHPVRVKETLSTTARMQRGSLRMGENIVMCCLLDTLVQGEVDKAGSRCIYHVATLTRQFTKTVAGSAYHFPPSTSCPRCHALAALQAVLTVPMDRVDATFVGAAAARQCACAARRVLGQLCFVSWAGSSNNAPSQRLLNRIMITHLVPRLLGTISPSTERSPLIIHAELLMTAPPLSNTLHVCRTLLDDSNDSHVPVLTASQRIHSSKHRIRL
ncbi:hypothetical protein GGX14DRAFT_580497 [Mycena pura]|uniref:Uncharacterized protein n=1 Tax=Mycena pura TaxID=153505 RepID=A0AAD6USS7_9AGAR|nr:hypothetical protein GGX14DRAFT_580497 [Mycena pura]